MIKRFVSLLLTLTIVGANVSAFSSGHALQRKRQAKPSPTATPTATPTPLPTPAPATSPTPLQTPELSPSPSSSPAAARTPLRADTTKTLAELQTRIAEILRKPELSSAFVGIKVASLDTGRILFEENASKLLRPASNMKIYTVSTALDRLSPDFRFTTSVYAAAKPDADGVIHRWANGAGLTIYGRGDPSIATRFNNGDYFKGIDALAAKIADAGVKRIEGDLVGDETYFIGPQYGSGWDWDDLTWYYGAEVSALTINDNSLDLFVKPGPRVGAPGEISTGPPDPFLTIGNRVTTGAKGSKRELSVYRGLGESTIEVSGIIPIDDPGYTGEVAISNPAMLYLHLLRSALAKRGINITGSLRVERASRMEWLGVGPEGNRLSHGQLATLHPPLEICNLQSPPLSVIAAQTLKPSQNLYTELILRTIGKQVPPPLAQDIPTTEYAGILVVKMFLKEAGLNPDALVLTDASGLSRNDMVTSEATLQLLTFMSKHRYAQIFRDALPIAGVDGTLRNRFRGTVAEGNLRAKTGSLSGVASLSGYVTTAAGEHLVFSIMVNNYPPDVNPRPLCLDPIGVLLASFAGQP